MDYLKSVSNGNTAFELKMLSTFIEQTTNELQKITKDSDKNKWDNIYAAIHKIKPSFHFIGASASEKLISQIELAFKEETNPEKLLKLINSFVMSAEMDIEAVKAEMKKYPAN